MIKRCFARLCCVLASTLLLGACATVGPVAIGNGRYPYNDVIQSTASQQTLLNIVRVHHNETPQFLDVAEVDEATTAGASITGGPSNIGMGAIGAITGVGSYQEAPTVRYIPLSGQALIAQVSTPVSVESLANLVNSDWDLGAVLTLGVDRATAGYMDYYPAIDALMDLDQYGAIVIAATLSTEAEASGKSKGLTFSSAPPAAKDTLTIYLQNKGVSPTQAECDGSKVPGAVVAALWKRLESIYGVAGQKARYLTIKSKGSQFVTAKKDLAPLLATRSAIGVLKAAAENESPSIAFLPEAQVRELMSQHDADGNCAGKFYLLDPNRSNKSEFESEESNAALNGISGFIKSGKSSQFTRAPLAIKSTPKLQEVEEALVHARRYMLIAKSSAPPQDAYTSVRRGDTWYSILDGDGISKRTLALINQFDTIQAVPTATAPLTPTISVGGSRS